MTRTPKTCGPDTNLAEATEAMWAADCGFLPVLDEAGKVAGVVTDRDMLIALGTRNRRASEIQVRDVMTAPALICRSGDAVERVLEIMAERQIRRLPVVDDGGQLIAVVSMNDVILRSDSRPGPQASASYEKVVASCKGICEHRPLVKQQAAAA